MRLSRNLKMTPVEIGALIFAVVWVLICIVFFFGLGGAEPGTERNGVGFVVVVSSVLVPIAVVWLAVSSARSARIMTDESERLQASMSAMRKVMIEVQEFQALGAPRAEERTRRLEGPATSARDGESTAPDAPAMFASSRPHGEPAPAEAARSATGPAAGTTAQRSAQRTGQAPGQTTGQTTGQSTGQPASSGPAMRDVSPPQDQARSQHQGQHQGQRRSQATGRPAPEAEAKPAAATPSPAAKTAAAPDDSQQSLKLDSGPDAGSDSGTVDVGDLIRAINFPENAEDEAGFEALRRTLVDRKVATLIQAAQDVLTLLSQDGIYMDDLTPDATRPQAWRLFAAGKRGADVAGLGAINDRSSLALSAGRMKSDAIFRDATLHFLRRFDDVLTGFEPRMSDGELVELAGTRTARAFMLLGRVTGSFD